MNGEFTHGFVVNRNEDFQERYFGWPSVVCLESGRILVGASGPRKYHADGLGKTSLFISDDNGAHFSAPMIVNDSPLDDRDVGLVSLGGERVLMSWFTAATAYRIDGQIPWMTKEDHEQLVRDSARQTAERIARYQGSWIRVSEDGGMTWGEAHRAPVSAPHGPIRLRSGRIVYVGAVFGADGREPRGQIAAASSTDDGKSWELLGAIPFPKALENCGVCEPHAVERTDGSLLAMIRVEGDGIKGLYRSVSTDGGATWSQAVPTGIEGLPAHLLRCSNGAIVLSYGWRSAPYGERARVSYDDGETWGEEIVLRDDGESWDLGYPSTAECRDGSMLTVYYQEPCAVEESKRFRNEDIKSIQFTKWRIREEAQK